MLKLSPNPNFKPETNVTKNTDTKTKEKTDNKTNNFGVENYIDMAIGEYDPDTNTFNRDRTIKIGDESITSQLQIKPDTAVKNESQVENNVLKPKEDKYDKSVNRPLTALDVEDDSTKAERQEMADWRRGIRKDHLTKLISAKPGHKKVNKWKMELASLRDDDEDKVGTGSAYVGRG